MPLGTEIPKGGGGANQKPSVGGVWIFSGTTHCVQEVPLVPMARVNRIMDVRVRTIYVETLVCSKMHNGTISSYFVVCTFRSEFEQDSKFYTRTNIGKDVKCSYACMVCYQASACSCTIPLLREKHCRQSCRSQSCLP